MENNRLNVVFLLEGETKSEDRFESKRRPNNFGIAYVEDVSQKHKIDKYWETTKVMAGFHDEGDRCDFISNTGVLYSRSRCNTPE